MKKLVLFLMLVMAVYFAAFAEESDNAVPRYEGLAIGGNITSQYALGKFSPYVTGDFGFGLSGELTFPAFLPANIDLGASMRVSFTHWFAREGNGLEALDGLSFQPGVFLRIPFTLGEQWFAVQPEVGYGLRWHTVTPTPGFTRVKSSYLEGEMNVALGLRWIPKSMPQLDVEAAPLYSIWFENESNTLSALGFRLGVMYRIPKANAAGYIITNDNSGSGSDTQCLNICNQKFKDLNLIIDNQKKEIDSLKGELYELKGLTDGQQTEIDSLKEVTDGQQTELDSLREVTGSQQTELDSIKGLTDSQQTEVNTLKSDIDSHEKGLFDLSEKHNSQQKNIDKLTDSVDEIKLKMLQDAEENLPAPSIRLDVIGDRLTPDGDGLNDAILFVPVAKYLTAGVAAWSIVILDPIGHAFRTFSGKGTLPESVEWDGLSDKGEAVYSRNTYSVAFTVEPSEKDKKRGNLTTVTANTSITTGLLLETIVPEREWKIVVNTINFDADKATFDTLSAAQRIDNEETLNDVVASIKAHPGSKVVIEGYANNVSGTEKEDKEELIPLSQSRAEVILELLVQKGIDRKVLTAVGKGGANPLADRNDRDNWWKNRRVEFRLKK